MGEEGVFISTYDKMLVPLGDTASIAIIKLVDPKDLLKPDTTVTCLYVIKASFSIPNLISNEIDKDPKVSLLLLTYLYDKEDDIALKRKIKYVEDFVKTQTGYSDQQRH